MTELDILLPFGLPPSELAADLFKSMEAPALALLAARARSENEHHDATGAFQRALPHEVWIARRFGMEDSVRKHGSLPIASALMPALNVPQQPGTWFIVQPVHIHIARDHLVLTDPRQLVISETESHALFEIAEPLFAEAGKRLVYGDAATWFVDAAEWHELETSSPDAASGHNIDIWMPKGAGERDWRKVQNDVQMHWFNDAVNEQREARRLRPVNSVWLWGGPSGMASARNRQYEKAFNLSGHLLAFRELVPEHTAAEDTAALVSSAARRNMLLLDDLLEPALSNDWARWLDNMKQLDETWFSPLLQALKSGKIDQVSLIATHDTRICRFTVTRSSLRKFWVKPSLASLCP